MDNRPESIKQSKLSNAIQLKGLDAYDQKQLQNIDLRIKKLVEKYESDKKIIQDVLKVNVPFNDPLSYLHKMDLKYISFEMAKLDDFFQKMQISVRQVNTKKTLSLLLKKINGFEYSGGNNILQKILVDLDSKLKSVERNEVMQIVEMDESYFSNYKKQGKGAKTVYRGDGRDSITPDSFENFQFSDIVAGGTADFSFRGVVEHTHSNTAKNGMVSTSSSLDVAHFWATSNHNYGIVYEISTSNYIHVANVLKKRHFKDRYPGQFEILILGNIPANNIVSATLYEKENVIAVKQNQ